MKQYIVFFILIWAFHIHENLYAHRQVQDSTVIFPQKNVDTITPMVKKKTEGIVLDVSGSDLTSKIKRVFLDGKQIHIHDIETIDIKDITMKQAENGNIDLYIYTNPKTNKTDSLNNISCKKDSL